MYHYTDGGLENVWLANGYQVHPTPFGQGVSFHGLEGLTQAICLALTQKAGTLSGVELRYIRSAGMLLSQPALGQLMGVDGQHVARWEKSGKVPRWADKLARLLYAAHAEGGTPIRCAAERVKPVGRPVERRIVLKEKAGHWEPVA